MTTYPRDVEYTDVEQVVEDIKRYEPLLTEVGAPDCLSDTDDDFLCGIWYVWSFMSEKQRHKVALRIHNADPIVRTVPTTPTKADLFTTESLVAYLKDFLK